MSLAALGSVITSPYQAIPTAYRLCCVGIGDSDVQGLGLSSLSATDCSFLLIVAALFEWATDGASGRTAGDVKATPLRMWSGSVADILITASEVIRTAGANGGGVSWLVRRDLWD